MISIFIPVYNGEIFLRETLESLLVQTYRDFETLCVDDSSTDNSYSILQEYAVKDSRIKVFQKPNGGDAPHSWQFAMPLLSGDFIMYMSQDDLLKPDTLEKLAGRQRETDADAVIPALTWYYGDATPSKTDRGVEGDLSPILTGKEAFEMMMDYTIPGFALWRSSIVKSSPVPLAAYNSDEYSQRKWCSLCRTVAFSDGEFVYRQNNPNAITRQFTDKQWEASLTDAMVLQLAVDLEISTQKIEQYANARYEDLWFHTMYFTLHKKTLSHKRRRHLHRLFSHAYRMMHRHISLKHWTYRWSAHNLLLFWLLINLKAKRAKLLHHAD